MRCFFDKAGIISSSDVARFEKHLDFIEKESDHDIKLGKQQLHGFETRIASTLTQSALSGNRWKGGKAVQ
ncbi:MAG: hypothetical protein D3909_19480 [Candidatus Electrothrix sp. ATG1]|nr:hypothetical protein [Candidatus Electrothrix sp. ATG1]